MSTFHVWATAKNQDRANTVRRVLRRERDLPFEALPSDHEDVPAVWQAWAHRRGHELVVGAWS